MLYNVAKEGIIEVNLTEGNVSADFDSMMDLMDNTASVYLDGASDDIFCLDVDFGARIQIIDIRYFFDSALSTSLIAPTVSFYYKNDPIDSYTNIPTSIGTNYYYATVSGVSAPRYIRMIHTVSGTAVSGTATGFIAFNDDTTVDFGEDGSRTTLNILTASESTTVNEIVVFNSGQTSANAHVFVEPMPAIGQYIALSDSEDGPWSGMADTSMAADDFSDGLRTDYQDGLNTTVTLGQLKLSSVVNGAGKYITKIVQKASGSSYSMLNVDGTFPDGSALKVDATDGTETYEIKTNIDKPKDFRVYSHFGSVISVGTYTTAYQLVFKRNWLENNAFQYDGDLPFYGYTDGSSYIGEEIFRHVPTKGAILISTVYNNGYQSYKSNFGLFFYNRLYSESSSNTMVPTSSQFITYHSASSSTKTNMLPIRMWGDALSGIWVYYRVISSSFVSVGYYLRYYDQYHTQLTYNYTSTKTIYDIDIVYETGYLWRTDLETISVKKTDNAYVEICSYVDELNTSDLRGICTTTDGGCWFVNGDYDIHKLDSSAELERSITDIDAPEELKFVLLDKDNSNFLWLITTNYVCSYDLISERIIFSNYFSNIENARSYLGGVALVLGNHEFHFFDKATKSASATLAPQSQCVLIPGVFASSFEDVNLSGSYYESDDLFVGGTATASSVRNTYTSPYGGLQQPWYAFDGNITQDNWRYGSYWQADAPAPQWLKYDLGAGNSACPNGLRIVLGTTDRHYFYFQGSNNDTDWTNISYISAYCSGSYLPSIHYFNNDTYYRYFRFYFTSVSNNSWPRVSDVSMFSSRPYFPNVDDVSWSNKEWKKVSYNSHLISPDEYKQFRLTIRSDGVADPTVDNIYLYDGVQLSNIGPKQYKNAYVKLVTPVDSTNILGDHDTNIKVWWDVPL